MSVIISGQNGVVKNKNITINNEAIKKNTNIYTTNLKHFENNSINNLLDIQFINMGLENYNAIAYLYDDKLVIQQLKTNKKLVYEYRKNRDLSNLATGDLSIKTKLYIDNSLNVYVIDTYAYRAYTYPGSSSMETHAVINMTVTQCFMGNSVFSYSTIKLNVTGDNEAIMDNNFTLFINSLIYENKLYIHAYINYGSGTNNSIKCNDIYVFRLLPTIQLENRCEYNIYIGQKQMYFLLLSNQIICYYDGRAYTFNQTPTGNWGGSLVEIPSEQAASIPWFTDTIELYEQQGINIYGYQTSSNSPKDLNFTIYKREKNGELIAHSISDTDQLLSYSKPNVYIQRNNKICYWNPKIDKLSFIAYDFLNDYTGNYNNSIFTDYYNILYLQDKENNKSYICLSDTTPIYSEN